MFLLFYARVTFLILEIISVSKIATVYILVLIVLIHTASVKAVTVFTNTSM